MCESQVKESTLTNTLFGNPIKNKMRCVWNLLVAKGR